MSDLSLNEARALPRGAVLVFRDSITRRPRGDGMGSMWVCAPDGAVLPEHGGEEILFPIDTGARFAAVVGSLLYVWAVQFRSDGSRWFCGHTFTIAEFRRFLDIVPDGQPRPPRTPPDMYWNGDTVYWHGTNVAEAEIWRVAVGNAAAAFAAG